MVHSLERSVKEDVQYLRASPLIKKETNVHGYVFDIKTGELQTIVE